MKTLQHILLSCMLFIGSTIIAQQQQYVIDGNTYTLATEASGEITLLWGTINDEYRFFSKKGTDIKELKNSYINGNYQEEYKIILKEQTASNVSKVKLTKGSLRDFFDAYNATKDTGYVTREKIKLSTRLGGFAGFTNSIFIENPNNINQVKFGVELELMDVVKLKRHAIVFRLSQTLANDEQKNCATQASLNYRFKFINTEKLALFVNTKIAAFTYNQNEITIPATATTPQQIEEVNSNGLEAPLAFGLGADFKVGPGHLFLTYNDIFSITQESNGSFPLDLTVGYKFEL